LENVASVVEPSLTVNVSKRGAARLGGVDVQEKNDSVALHPLGMLTDSEIESVWVVP